MKHIPVWTRVGYLVYVGVFSGYETFYTRKDPLKDKGGSSRGSIVEEKDWRRRFQHIKSEAIPIGFGVLKDWPSVRIDLAKLKIYGA